MIWIFKTICIFYDFPYKTVINHNLWFNSSWSCSKCLLFGKKGSYHFSLSSEYSKLWFLPIIFKLFTIFSNLMSQRAVKEWMIANCMVPFIQHFKLMISFDWPSAGCLHVIQNILGKVVRFLHIWCISLFESICHEIWIWINKWETSIQS